MIPPPPRSTLFPHTTLFRSWTRGREARIGRASGRAGEVSLHARPPSRDVPQASLDHAPVRGLRLRGAHEPALPLSPRAGQDRKSTRLNSSHLVISYAVFCLK